MWTEHNNALHKTFTFATFIDAINWMQQSAPLIDAANHHPEWTNVYNKVMVKLCTHDAGNIITQKDYELARILDTLYDAF